jgi:ATP-dependent Clp protease ATP-binding subunit ClpC
MIFDRFTEKTMEAVMMAQAESRRLGQNQVGTEMLVVGVAAEGTDAGSRALGSLGVGLSEARSMLEEVVGYSSGRALSIPFTSAAKKVLEDSIEFAHSQGKSSVDTSHLLWAVVDQEEPFDGGAKLLGRLLSCDSVEATRKKLLGTLEREENAWKTYTSGSVASPKGDGDVDLTETLKYGKDLTEAAREGKMDPLIGREEELKRTIRILGRRSKNNPVLVGEAGVGKTSIAEGLAQRIATGRVPAALRDKRVVQLDIALLLAGTRYRGDFEERLRAVIKEVSDSNRRVILVIDEVHTLVGSGGNGGEGGGIDAANLLKPALARGELQCIGATTLDEYRKYIEKDPALERRFQPVTVPEPTQEEAVLILKGLASKYERHHRLSYTQEALTAAVKLASQYIADRFLPDKAIDVMDEAGSKVRQQLSEDDTTAAELWAASQELKTVKAQKKAAVISEQFDEAKQLKVREMELIERLSYLNGGGASPGTHELLEELRGLKAQMKELVDAERYGEAHELKAREKDITERISRTEGVDSANALVDRPVTEEDMAEVVAGWTGIAVEQVGASESRKLMGLEKALHKTIIGQDEAVDAVARALRRARVGLRNPDRPIASFMFCGPTGVGKTHVCKTLASTFFGSADSMIRLDMSEFMDKHTVSKLIGAPPGYVGYSDGGTVTEAVRRRPYSLLLFDEVEKAHPDVFNIMLQLLDDGRLTDSKGRTVSFANTLIVMTSNLGSRAVQKGARGGFGLSGVMADDEEEENYAAMKELVMDDMKSFFRPEFVNRLDEVVVFRALTKDNLRAIAENEFQQVLARLGERDLDVRLTQAFKDRVVDQGYDPAFGARPLRRAISSMLEDTLAEHLLEAACEGHDDQDDRSTTKEAPAARQTVEVDIDEKTGKATVVQMRESSMAA